MGALSVTGTPKYREPFGTLGGIVFADYNNYEDVAAMLWQVLPHPALFCTAHTPSLSRYVPCHTGFHRGLTKSPPCHTGRALSAKIHILPGKALLNALKAQVDKLLHISNYFYNIPAAEACEKIREADNAPACRPKYARGKLRS